MAYPIRLRGEVGYSRSTFEVEGNGDFLRAVDVDGDGRDELLHNYDAAPGYTRLHDNFEVYPRQSRYDAVWRGGFSGVIVSDDIAPVTADLDGDGYLEVSTIEGVFTFYTLIPPDYPEDVKFTLQYNTEPTWASVPYYEVMDNRLVDFTGDGAFDLLMTRDLDGYVGQEEVDEGFLVPGPIVPSLTVDEVFSLTFHRIRTTGDVDGDGYEDLLAPVDGPLVAHAGPLRPEATPWVFRMGNMAEGGGSYQTEGSTEMTLQDFDGDGIMDLCFHSGAWDYVGPGGTLLAPLDYREEYLHTVRADSMTMVLYGPLEGTLDPHNHPRRLVLMPVLGTFEGARGDLVPDVDEDGRAELVINQVRPSDSVEGGVLGMYWLRGGEEGW